MKRQNSNFISETCELCGRSDLAGTCFSEIILRAGYGSTKYDGTELSMNVCGDCIDRLFDIVLKEE